VTIQGPGANGVTVSGNHASRVFVISGTEHAPPEPTAISGLTITTGDSGSLTAVRSIPRSLSSP
jgi:hypothetical protein